MQINKNSWHYKLYHYTYSFFDKERDIPESTNLCQYVQRMLWAGLAMIPCMAAISAFFAVIIITYYLLVLPFQFIRGLKPIDWKDPSLDEYDFVSYNGLQIGKIQLYPWHVLLLLALVAIEVLCWQHFTSVMVWSHGIILSLLVVGGALALFFWSSNETIKMIRAWMSAKKNKVCPLVEFTNNSE